MGPSAKPKDLPKPEIMEMTSDLWFLPTSSAMYW